jgi:hypothetical protein
MQNRRRSRPQTTVALRAVCLVFLAASLLQAASAFAQISQIAPDKRAQFEAAIARFMAANGTPGVSVAIVENGAEEWAAGFGSADLEGPVPATSRTLYRLGSISKPITATAALLLWQQGNSTWTFRCKNIARLSLRKGRPSRLVSCSGIWAGFVITNLVRRTIRRSATRGIS